MSKLNLCGEHAGAGTNSPGNDGLGNDTLLYRLDDLVFFHTTNLTKQNQNFAFGVLLVSEQVVDESCARISVTTNGNTLIHAISVLADDVVQLVGHAARFGDIADGTLAVQFRSDD